MLGEREDERWLARQNRPARSTVRFPLWGYTYNIKTTNIYQLRGQSNKKLALISGYRVCNSSISSTGDTTALAQQYSTILSKCEGKHLQNIPHPHR
jgi:hypothetical protein